MLPRYFFASDRAGYNFRILQAVTKVNHKQHKWFVSKVKDRLGDLKDRKIAVLGLAFKPESDDMRKAVSIEIIRSFVEEGARVSAYDPMAMKNAKLENYGSDVDFVVDLYEALDGADCLALVTEWDEFATLDWNEVRKLMRGNLVADGRNLYDPRKIREAGFEYLGMGRV